MHTHTGIFRFIKQITVLSKTGIKVKTANACSLDERIAVGEE